MEMFLMIACLSLFGLAAMSLAFAAATRPETSHPETDVKPLQVQPSAPERFFVEPAPPQIPIEALLLQIENHVRVEQAAAESFVGSPTVDLLHSRTISPLVQ